MKKVLLSSLKEHAYPGGILPVKYLMTATVELVENKKVLFVSFFSQSDNPLIQNKNADYRVYIWDNAYLTEILQENGSYKWSKACLGNIIGHWYYGWNNNKAACYTLGERELIAEFLKSKCNKPGDELQVIQTFQQKIMDKKLQARYKAITDKIDAVMDKVPSLPSDFNKWVYNGPFGFSRYVYYKREGKTIRAFCTECKKKMIIPETILTKKTVKHNNAGVCPECGLKIIYKATGKTKHLSDRNNFAIIQKFENDIIVRYFSGSKSYNRDYKKPELSYFENVREIYSFEKGNLQCKRYENAYFLGSGKVRWCNDNGKKDSPKSYLYTRNLSLVLKDTKWKYSCLYELAKEVAGVRIDAFLADYIAYPGIEYLIKFKLYNFVDDKLSTSFGRNWSGINFKGKGIKEIFGIEKHIFMQMQRLNLGTEGLSLLKFAFKKGIAFTDQEIRWVAKNEAENSIITLLDYSTPHKIIKYAKKQSNSRYSIHNVLSEWCDYIGQCKELKFDLTNTFVLYPKDLIEKHEEYSLLADASKLKQFNAKVKEAYTIMNETCTYSNKEYLIRPAKDVFEIVKEGHKLRHCVGSTQYSQGVANGQRAIFFVRKADQPEIPFYTLDLNLKSFKITQCYGYKNCYMTKEVESFVNRWHKVLTKKKVKGKVA